MDLHYTCGHCSPVARNSLHLTAEGRGEKEEKLYPKITGLHFKARLSAKSLLWKSVFIHIEIGTNYHNKNFALRLALKERLSRTRKWPISQFISLTQQMWIFLPFQRKSGVFFKVVITWSKKEINRSCANLDLLLMSPCFLMVDWEKFDTEFSSSTQLKMKNSCIIISSLTRFNTFL